MIQVDDVVKTFGRFTAVDHVSLHHPAHLPRSCALGNNLVPGGFAEDPPEPASAPGRAGLGLLAAPRGRLGLAGERRPPCVASLGDRATR